ncbi:phage tail assembly chaperone [Pseudomonas plecoglossicida]|uniref:phage tail assembly chaperone n=1 Tax=Pseudomonas putida group TaxID=136845 RepID=UPI002410024D|nr:MULTISPECIES: phage tail assembly chaperone [Pseudomonas putida group]MDQ7967106.1 phage tail assembly chaperone [Pseudomonas plecoglossicida]WFG05302.1 phage tail assembly chaperone [Pseudomonas putida]
MSRSKVHYGARDNRVFAIGEVQGSERFIEIENFEEALEAFNEQKDLLVEDGILVIRESRALRMQEVRRVRDDLLVRSDVIKLTLDDQAEISGDENKTVRQALAAYRQALRDVTLQDPFNVDWPTLETNNE